MKKKEIIAKMEKAIARIAELESGCLEITNRLKQLECQHTNTDLVKETQYPWNFPYFEDVRHFCYEKCIDCGKILRYLSEEEYKKKEIEGLEKELISKGWTPNKKG